MRRRRRRRRSAGPARVDAFFSSLVDRGRRCSPAGSTTWSRARGSHRSRCHALRVRLQGWPRRHARPPACVVLWVTRLGRGGLPRTRLRSYRRERVVRRGDWLHGGGGGGHGPPMPSPTLRHVPEQWQPGRGQPRGDEGHVGCLPTAELTTFRPFVFWPWCGPLPVLRWKPSFGVVSVHSTARRRAAAAGPYMYSPTGAPEYNTAKA